LENSLRFLQAHAETADAASVSPRAAAVCPATSVRTIAAAIALAASRDITTREQFMSSFLPEKGQFLFR
jgi:hypothetical protein